MAAGVPLEYEGAESVTRFPPLDKIRGPSDYSGYRCHPSLQNHINNGWSWRFLCKMRVSWSKSAVKFGYALSPEGAGGDHRHQFVVIHGQPPHLSGNFPPTIRT